MTSIILSQIILVKALEVPPCIHCFILQKSSFHVNSSSDSMMVTIRMNFPVKLAFYTTLLFAQKANPHIVSRLWAVFAFSCHPLQIFHIRRRFVNVKYRYIFDFRKCYSVTTGKLHEKFVNLLPFLTVVKFFVNWLFSYWLRPLQTKLFHLSMNIQTTVLNYLFQQLIFFAIFKSRYLIVLFKTQKFQHLEKIFHDWKHEISKDLWVCKEK